MKGSGTSPSTRLTTSWIPRNTVMQTSKTVEVLALAYIGGRGSLWGGMAVAFPFVFFIEALRSSTTGEMAGLHLVIYGLLMILVMIFYPAGLVGLYNWIKGKVLAALSRGDKGALPQVEA